MPRSYPSEFRARVLALVEAGRPIKQVAEMLGISDQTIYNWRRQRLIDTGQAPGFPSTESAKLIATRRRIGGARAGAGHPTARCRAARPVVPPKGASRPSQ